MTQEMKVSRSRQAVFEALKIAAPGTFDAALQRSFLAEGLDLKFADLNLDSLAEMEFCIAIELSTGVTLLPSELAELSSTDAVELRIRQALG